MRLHLERCRWLMHLLVTLISPVTLVYVQVQPSEATAHNYSVTPNLEIPDATGGPTTGTPVSSTITIFDNYSIQDVNVVLHIEHSMVGDLIITLTHDTTTIRLTDRPGVPCMDCWGPYANLITTLDDESTGGQLEYTVPPNGPSYQPLDDLSAFDGQNVSGDWTLTITDDQSGDTGSLVSWGLLTDASYWLLTATGACDAANLNVTISTGDLSYNIIGTGPGLPLTDVSSGTYPLTGPGSWVNVTITEVGGDMESVNLGSFTCATVPVAASAVCNLGNLDVTISNGDTPFDIIGSGPGLPQNGVIAGTYTLTGPGSWTHVTVTEVGGNGQSIHLGNFACATNNLTASATCNINNLVVTIEGIATPINVTGLGPGLPINNVTAGTHTLTGPGNWYAVTVTEVGGSGQSIYLGDLKCATNQLVASAVCINNDLMINIAAGDMPFNISGTGASLPINALGTGTYFLQGPAVWTGVMISETTGDQQSISLGTLNCTAPPPTTQAGNTGEEPTAG